MTDPKWYVTWYPGCQKVMVKVEVTHEFLEHLKSKVDTRDARLLGVYTTRAQEIAVNELHRLGVSYESGRGNRLPRWVDEDGTVLVRIPDDDGKHRFGKFEAWYVYPVTVYDATRTLIPPDYHDDAREFHWKEVV